MEKLKKSWNRRGSFATMLVLVILVSSCALSKSQIKEVNNFAESTETFADFPSEVWKEAREILLAIQLYEANSLNSQDPINDVEEKLNSLHGAEGVYELYGEAGELFDNSIDLIDKYAQALKLISSDKILEDLEESASELGSGIDEVAILYNSNPEGTKKVPSNLGEIVGEIVGFAGKSYVRYKQAKEVKEFVVKGDTLIQAVTNTILTQFNSAPIMLLELQELQLKEAYKGFLKSILDSHSDPVLIIEQDKEYLKLLRQIKFANDLRESCISSIEKLQKAHSALCLQLSKRATISEILEEVRSLQENLKEMTQLIESLKTTK